MKTIVRFLLYIASVIPLLVLTVFLLMQVPAVNAWVLQQLLQMTPGLEVRKIQGQLFQELTLMGIHYETDGIQVTIDHFHSQFSPTALLTGTVLFEGVDVEGVDVVSISRETHEDEQAFTGLTLPVAFEFKVINVTDVSIAVNEQSWRIDKFTTRLRGFVQTITVDELQIHSASTAIHLNGQLELKSTLPVDLQIAAQGEIPDLGPVQGSLTLIGDLQKLNFVQNMTHPYDLETVGSVLLDADKPYITLQTNWQKLFWPTSGKSQYFSDQGELHLQGTLDDYELRVNADFDGVDIPGGWFALQARGDSQQLQFSKLIIEILEGVIQGQGQLQWQDYLSWNFDIEARRLDPQTWAPDYSGQIDFEVLLSGNIHDSLMLTADLSHLQGEVNSHALSGKALGRYQNETLMIEDLLVEWGINRLSVNGTAGDQSHLVYALNAGDLAQLYPALSGRLDSEGTLQGNINYPRIDARVTAHALAYEHYQIRQLNLEGLLDLSGNKNVELSVAARQLDIDGVSVDSLNIDFRGHEEKHSLATHLVAEQGRMDLELTGHYNRQKSFWDGHIETLRIMERSMGEWSMQRVTPVTAGLFKEKWMLENQDLCLRQTGSEAEFCVRTSQDSQRGQQVSGFIKNLPLDSFAAWLPDNLHIDSQLDADFAFDFDQTPTGELSIDSYPGYARLSHEGRVYRIPLKASRLQAQWLQNQLRSRFVVDFNDQDRINGDLQVNDLSKAGLATLDSRFDVAIADLGFMNALISEINQIEGGLDMQLSFAGTVAEPRLTAMNGHVRDAGFFVPDAGISIDDINIEARQQAEKTLMTGTAETGGRVLTLDGKIQQQTAGQVLMQIDLKGKDVKIVQRADAQIWVDPDLSLRVDAKGLSLTGKIGVPKAHIIIEELPEGAVTISRDEVIITHNQPQQPASRVKFNAQMIVSLGRQVHIEGFGLNTRLQGDLRATYEQNRFRLFNELELVDGVYQSYGQDLTIKKGKLLFTGASDNPGINLLAYRKATDWDDKVIAYLELTGTLKNTKTRVYTKPTLSESEALAYLLTGAPLGQASGSNAELIASAAMSLGKDYMSGVMAVIGIDEFDVKSTRAGRNSMILGKRITPKLFIRYIMDVLTSKMLFSVEYKLTEHISIETTSGDTHSGDVKYSIEFD